MECLCSQTLNATIALSCFRKSNETEVEPVDLGVIPKNLDSSQSSCVRIRDIHVLQGKRLDIQKKAMAPDLEKEIIKMASTAARICKASI